jgi:hypothetical protein
VDSDLSAQREHEGRRGRDGQHRASHKDCLDSVGADQGAEHAEQEPEEKHEEVAAKDDNGDDDSDLALVHLKPVQRSERTAAASTSQTEFVASSPATS